MKSLILLFILSLSTNIAIGQWAQTNGPYNGTINCIATSGTNIFVGTAGSRNVYFSANNGGTWVKANNGLPNANVKSLAINGTNIFAGTYGGGVYSSTNNGSSWTAVNNGLNTGGHTSLALNGTTLFAGTNYSGVWQRPLSEVLTGVNEIKNESSTSVFPNPFSSQTTLQTDRVLNGATLTVYNSFGQAVKYIENISGQTVQLSRDKLPSGVYFVQLTEDNEILSTDKVIISD